jgi:dephospho-CoA kinase
MPTKIARTIWGEKIMKVGISGKMRSGKDYLCEIIQEAYPQLKRIGFADPIKKLTKDYFGIEKEHPKARRVYQLLGTEIGRYINDNFWIDKALENNPDNIIITDVRFQNEASELEKRGFIVIRIEADYETRSTRGTITGEGHPSEIDLDNYNFKYRIYNNYDMTKDRLLEQFNRILEEVKR